MGALGTYKVLFVRPDNHLFEETVQAVSKAAAKEQAMAVYPTYQHVETTVRTPSEGELNQAEANREVEAKRKAKQVADEAKKAQAKRDARKEMHKK